MSSQPIRVGIIGYGLSAKVFHIPFIDASTDFTLHSVLQRSPPKSPTDNTHVSVQRPGVKWVQTEDVFFADGELDVVVLSTPPVTHATMAKRALSSGKHGTRSFKLAVNRQF